MKVFAQNPDGIINCYTFNLDDFFSNTFLTSYFRLNYSWCGHVGNVKETDRHPNLPYVASFSDDGELLLYKVTIPKVLDSST
jgi:hypothetical protein